MRLAKFRAFTVIAGLSLLTTTVAVPRPAAAGQYHGALAVELKTGAYGFGVNYSNKGDAITAALQKCNSRTNGRNDCVLEAWFSDYRCGAVAKNSSRTGSALGNSASEAGDNAINKIGGGRVVGTACNKE
jgi:hypothetical protein